MSVYATLYAAVALWASRTGLTPTFPDEPAMQLAKAILVQNLEREGFKPTDKRFKDRLLHQSFIDWGSRAEGSFSGVTNIRTVGKSRTVVHFSYPQERGVAELRELKQLIAQECRVLMTVYREQLGFPRDLVVTKETVGEAVVSFELRRPLIAGHRSTLQFSIEVGRYGGVLLSANGDLPYNDLPPPKVTAEEATLTSLNELQTVGGFSITMLRDPALMVGKPSAHETYRDRVSLDRVSQFGADQPMTFWRLDLFESDGVSYLGMHQVIEVDTQTGEIVGHRRFFGRPEPLPPPAVSWKWIGRVSVVGDQSRVQALVEPLSTRERPGGKPVMVQSGKLIYACRYDATNNILWRQLPGGRYEPGRPAPSLVKALKAHAR